jgi:[ribosomal protein S5]-alanine N-acetyltransferase
MMNLVSERLLIRYFRPDDWQDLVEYLSDPEVVRFEPYDVYSEEQAQQEAIRRAGDKAFYAVCLIGTGKMIGNLYLAKGDFDTWELGYVFNRRYQGQGYATESARILISHAFANFGARRIVAYCSKTNENSHKLLERLGMRREGLFLQNVSFKTDAQGEPIWFDSYAYAVLATEWPIPPTSA